jgi:glyoxylase-like metal-dependent hydrolase (beta-lactamase superfamily II)
MEIVAGVHQIRLPFPQDIPEYTNVYVVEGSKGNLLIDSGWDSSETLWAFREGLMEERLKFEDINWIVVTHVHPDHFGLAGKLKDLCQARVAVHVVEGELVESRYGDPEGLLRDVEEVLGRNGVPQPELATLRDVSLWMRQFASPQMPDVMLSDGDRVSTGPLEFEVLRTPGHSPGHVCLYERKRRWLFSGDHVLFHTTPHVGFHPQSGENPLKDYIDSTRMLEELPANFVFPGHGPVFNSLKLRTAEILDHHEQRRRAIVKVLSQGLKTAYEVASETAWKPEVGGVAYNDLGPWERRLAVFETIAHLKLLSFQGKIASIERDGAVQYLARE